MTITFTPNFKALVIGILITTSTLSLFVYKERMLVNILLFDCILLLSLFVFFRDILASRIDNFVKLFILIILFQTLHNLVYSDTIYAVKELIQGIELVIFYIILCTFFLNKYNTYIALKYTFYCLFFVLLLAMTVFLLPIEVCESEVPYMSPRSYIKCSEITNSLIPIVIFGVYFYRNYYYSRLKRISFILIAIIASYLLYFGNSRTFFLLMIFIFLSYMFNKKRRKLAVIFCILIASILIFNQNNILNKYNAKYSYKVSQSFEHITNGEPYDPWRIVNKRYTGPKQLQFIGSPSNRARLHYLKLVYNVAKNDFLLGIGHRQAHELTNLHGTIFVFFVSFGFLNLLLFLIIIYQSYILSIKSLNTSLTSLKLMNHHYLIYAVISLLFLGGGTFAILPFIIAAALINSRSEQKLTKLKNFSSIGYIK